MTTAMTARKSSFRAHKNGTVRIAYRGKIVTTLAGKEAARFLARIDGVSPRGQLDGLRAEVLVIHSASDELVPVEESRRLVEALRTRVSTTYSELTMFEHTHVASATRIGTIAREFARLAVDLQVLLRYAG